MSIPHFDPLPEDADRPTVKSYVSELGQAVNELRSDIRGLMSLLRSSPEKIAPVEEIPRLNPATWSSTSQNREPGKWHRHHDPAVKSVILDPNNFTHKVNDLTQEDWEQASKDIADLDRREEDREEVV